MPFSSGSGIAITSTQTGDDPLNNAVIVTPLGTDSREIGPLQTPAGAMPNSSVTIGTSPNINDLLTQINFIPWDTTNAAAYLEDGLAGDLIFGGVAAGAPGTATSALGLTSAIAFTATQNFYAGCILWATYTPTGAGVPIKFMRRILSHVAVSNATAFAPIVTHNLPAGATLTGWGVRPRDSAWEIRAFNQPATAPMVFNRRAKKEGGYRLSVDSALFAIAGGKIS
jgi:hypothetical protein